jgi:hypothetical protein
MLTLVDLESRKDVTGETARHRTAKSPDNKLAEPIDTNVHICDTKKLFNGLLLRWWRITLQRSLLKQHWNCYPARYTTSEGAVGRYLFTSSRTVLATRNLLRTAGMLPEGGALYYYGCDKSEAVRARWKTVRRSGMPVWLTRQNRPGTRNYRLVAVNCS